MVFSIVRVPWLSEGTEAVFSGTSNQDSFLLFGNALPVPDGSYVPKGLSWPFWRLSSVIKECCTISFPWKAPCLSFKLLNHHCQLQELIKLFWVTNQFPSPWIKLYPGGMVILLCLSFLEKALEREITFHSFLKPSGHLQPYNIFCWRTLGWSFKKQGLST